LDPTISTAQIISNVISKLTRLRAAYHSAAYSGRLDNGIAANHLRYSLSVSAEWSNEPDLISGFIEQFCDASGGSRESINRLVGAIRLGVRFGGPLYVGMTTEQSFGKRLDQHMAYQTGFGQAVRQNRLVWSDLEFHCLSLEGFDVQAVRPVEKIIQAALRPPYCRG
jgi:hypothetical protein